MIGVFRFFFTESIGTDHKSVAVVWSLKLHVHAFNIEGLAVW